MIQASAQKLRVLCAREFQNSIQDSVHKLLAEQVDALGLSAFFAVQQTTIVGRNGSEFIFSGLRNNVQSLKGLEGIDVCWCEEAQTMSPRSWELLTPTIRKEGSRIICTWNPDQEEDATYQRLVVNRGPDCLDVVVNHTENQWFPEVLRAEMLHAYATDPEAASHTWGGELRRVSDAQVLRGRWVICDFTPEESWSPLYGLDFGFATDPTAAVKAWIEVVENKDGSRRSTRTLYVEHEACGVGVDVDDTPILLDRLPGARTHAMYADSARPETISYLRRNGYPRVLPASKWPGSVDDGVEHLRSYERIVIHPRCVNTAREAKLWSYKTDRNSGLVLPVLQDGNDHCFDAIRYALCRVIQSGKPHKGANKPPPKPPDYGNEREKRRISWKTA